MTSAPRPGTAIAHYSSAQILIFRALFTALQLARATRLAPQGYVSRDDLDTLRSQAAALKASVAADQAALETAQVELDYTVITPIAVVFSLPADELAALPIGASSQDLPVVAFSRDDRTRIASGELALTDNRIDPTTNTVRLRAIFRNRRELLKPGEFVNAHLLLSVQHDVLTLPARAIQFSDHGAFVWFLRPDSTVEQRAITTGASSERFVAITQYMMDWGGGWYGMFFGPLFMILVLALVIAVAVLLFRWLAGPSHTVQPPHGTPPGRTALDILKERYARGEINKEEFEERRRTLGD